MGNPPERFLEVVCSRLESILRSKCRLLNKIPLPEHSHNHWRKQHNAEIIMQEVANLPEVKFIDKDIPTLMITDEDLYFKD